MCSAFPADLILPGINTSHCGAGQLYANQPETLRGSNSLLTLTRHALTTMTLANSQVMPSCEEVMVADAKNQALRLACRAWCRVWADSLNLKAQASRK